MLAVEILLQELLVDVADRHLRVDRRNDGGGAWPQAEELILDRDELVFKARVFDRRLRRRETCSEGILERLPPHPDQAIEGELIGEVAVLLDESRLSERDRINVLRLKRPEFRRRTERASHGADVADADDVEIPAHQPQQLPAVEVGIRPIERVEKRMLGQLVHATGPRHHSRERRRSQEPPGLVGRQAPLRRLGFGITRALDRVEPERYPGHSDGVQIDAKVDDRLVRLDELPGRRLTLGPKGVGRAGSARPGRAGIAAAGRSTAHQEIPGLSKSSGQRRAPAERES